MTLSEAYQKNRTAASFSPEKSEISEVPAGLVFAGTPEEQRLLENVAERITVSSLGREILNEAAGYTVRLMPLGSSRGACNPESRELMLSDGLSEDQLVSTLVHEARHAGQFERGCHKNFKGFQAQSVILETRLTEADAVACSAGVCAEMSEKRDTAPFGDIRRSYPGVAQAFAEAYMKNDPENRRAEALTAAALAWYDNDALKMLYERSYVVKPADDDFKDAGGRPAPKALDAGKTVSMVCTLGGGNYFTGSAELLHTEKFAAVSEETRSWMQDYARGWEIYYGEKCRDTSVEKMVSYPDPPFVRSRMDAEFGPNPPAVTERPEIILLQMRREKAFEKYFEKQKKKETQRSLLMDSLENSNSR